MTLTRRRFTRHGLMMTAAAALLAAAPAFAQAPSGKLVLYTSQPEKDATQTVAAATNSSAARAEIHDTVSASG